MLVDRQIGIARGPLLSLAPLVRGGWGKGEVNQHLGLVLVAVCCDPPAGDGGDRCQSLGFGVTGDCPNILAVCSVQEVFPALSPRLSDCTFQQSLCRLDLYLAAPSPPLSPGRPAEVLYLSFMSSIHHLLDLAQIVMTRTHSLSMLVSGLDPLYLVLEFVNRAAVI